MLGGNRIPRSLISMEFHGKAANALNKLLPIMHHKSIRLRTKMAIYQVIVISTLLYGTEAWNTMSQEEKRSVTFHSRCLRRILGVSWRDYVSNTEIFKGTGQALLINILQQKRLSWLSCIVCMLLTRLPHHLIHWILSERGCQATHVMV